MGFRFGFAAGLLLAVVTVGLFGFGGSTSPAAAGGFPPPLPTIYYGSVSQVASGGVVTAYVVDGGTQTTCGTGKTLLDGAQVVYTVAVAQDGQTAGCGKAGRTAQLTFRGPGEPVARPATVTTPWVVLGPGYTGAEFNAVLGDPPPIQVRALTPQLSKAQ